MIRWTVSTGSNVHGADAMGLPGSRFHDLGKRGAARPLEQGKDDCIHSQEEIEDQQRALELEKPISIGR